MSIAASFDLAENRVPNRLIFFGAAGGFIISVFFAPPQIWSKVILSYILRLIAAAVILFPFFVLRLFGAGDIKIMAVGSAIFGLAGGAEIIAAGLISGAILGISKLIIQNSFKRRFLILSAYFMHIFRTKELIPYCESYQDNDEGVIPFTACLLAGFIFLIFISGSFRATL